MGMIVVAVVQVKTATAFTHNIDIMKHPLLLLLLLLLATRTLSFAPLLATTTKTRRHSPTTNSPTTVLLQSSTSSSSSNLLPGRQAIDQHNPQLYDSLELLRQQPDFRFYSVDILASCEYLPQELFECYSETCEIYPVDDDEVRVE